MRRTRESWLTVGALLMVAASTAFASDSLGRGVSLRDGGRFDPRLPDAGIAARFTDFTPAPKKLEPPTPDSNCIGTRRDGGCVFEFETTVLSEEQELARVFFPDGGRRPSVPRLSLNDNAESVTLEFSGGSCNVTTLVGDGGCWVQLSSITQGDSQSRNYTLHSFRGWPQWVGCDAGLPLCDAMVRCDCTPKPPPRGFTAIATDGGERTGNTVPRRKP